MFDIGWSEMLVIGVVALIAIGPKELPGVLRSIGQWTAKIRRMASEFQGQFHEAMREAEMSDLKKQVDDIGDTARNFTKDPLNLPGADSWDKPAETWTPTDHSVSGGIANPGADQAIENNVGEGAMPSPTSATSPPSTEPGLDAPPHAASAEPYALPKTEPGDIPLPASLVEPPKFPEHDSAAAAHPAHDAGGEGGDKPAAAKPAASGSVPA